MKNIIFFVILSEVLFSLTLMVERNQNSIIPYYLRLDTNETLITLSSSYDSLTHKKSVSAHLHIYIKLFSKEKTKKTSDINETSKAQKTSYTYKINSNLGIKMRNKKPCVQLKNTYTALYGKFTFYEEITPAIPFYFNENTALEYKINNKMFFINKSFSYKQKGMTYSLGIHFYKIFSEFVRTMTLSLNGNTSTDPFIYFYNISTTYRVSLMHKKYFYLSIKPYILISKKYNFKAKPAFKASINYDF